MCPAVADVAQLADEAALGLSERVLEDDVPLVPHDGQDRLRVPVEGPAARPVVAQALLRDVQPAGAVGGLQLALDERLQAVVHQLQRLADPLDIALCHGDAPYSNRSP